MADISKIQLPNGSEYDIKDKTSGYITSSSLPTKTSELTNDSGFLTLETLPVYDGTVVTG